MEGWVAEGHLRTRTVCPKVFHPPTRLALLKPQELPCSDFPTSPPPCHRRPKLARTADGQLATASLGYIVPEATKAFHTHFKDVWLS